MAKIDMSSNNVHLHQCEAESTPFQDCEFDLVTAYSFLDHLEDCGSLLAEAYRVLKPNGVFYSDLNPNQRFTKHLESINTDSPSDISPVLARELRGMLHNGEHYQETYGINACTLEDAEPVKTHAGGFDADEVLLVAKSIGFSKVSYEYDWFLGEAVMLHERPVGTAKIIDEYLRFIAPASSHLFKYVRFYFIR
jgi:ubiquinone/menaquinone biosynthesis C-methylase UbiE